MQNDGPLEMTPPEHRSAAMTQRILIQIDGDAQPSSFDSVVAIDAGVERLLRYAGVSPTSITGLVHGAMFTRGGDDLKQTAIFVGGSDVDVAEDLFRISANTFFGPVRVSMMLDANGCNTTAAAAVVSAARHQTLRGSRAVVLGGTGPVGRRVTQLLALEGADVTLTSRNLERASEACRVVAGRLAGATPTPASARTPRELQGVLDESQIVIACGAAGVELVEEKRIRELESLSVAIDLNAVPPAGIGGVNVTDKAAPLGHGVGYGAIGVGGLKMKTHKAAIQALFETNDKCLDAEEIYAIAKSLS